MLLKCGELYYRNYLNLNNNSYSNHKQNGRVKELSNLDSRDQWHLGPASRTTSLMRFQGHR